MVNKNSSKRIAVRAIVNAVLLMVLIAANIENFLTLPGWHIYGSSYRRETVLTYFMWELIIAVILIAASAAFMTLGWLLTRRKTNVHFNFGKVLAVSFSLSVIALIAFIVSLPYWLPPA